MRLKLSSKFCARALTAAKSRPNSTEITENETREAKSSHKRMSSSGVQCLLRFCAMIERAVDIDHSD
jgi:hypothetical protein